MPNLSDQARRVSSVNFSAPAIIPVSGTPYVLSSGDFNGDGISDIVVGYESPSIREGAFEFYAGGAAFDDLPDHEWPYSFRSDRWTVQGGNVINAGDVNDDDIINSVPFLQL